MRDWDEVDEKILETARFHCEAERALLEKTGRLLYADKVFDLVENGNFPERAVGSYIASRHFAFLTLEDSRLSYGDDISKDAYILDLIEGLSSELDLDKCERKGSRNPIELHHIISICEAVHMFTAVKMVKMILPTITDFTQDHPHWKEWRNKRDRFRKWQERELKEIEKNHEFFKAAGIDPEEMKQKISMASAPGKPASHKGIIEAVKARLLRVLYEDCNTGIERGRLLSGILDCVKL